MVLKLFEAPATTVRPGSKPPSREPLNAIFKIGRSVGITSFALKNDDLESTEADLILPAFSILSNRLI
jgi:hypothetical protein